MAQLTIYRESWPIAGNFTISRGSKSSADVIRVTLQSGEHVGQGECVPYGRYGETLDSVCQQLKSVEAAIEAGADRQHLQSLLPAGAARNAIDCAFWDLDAKRSGVPVAETLGHRFLGARETYFTLSMGTPQDMGESARLYADHHTLKIKVGAENPAASIQAVRSAAPFARLIVDANEAWNEHNIAENMLICSRSHVAMIEQPLPVGQDAILSRIPHVVPICADESAHQSTDLAGLCGHYDFVNIKLDKTGGLTEAMIMHKKARELGFGIMVGCMVSTSLAMAPAMIVAQDAEHVDLDGPLLLEKDRPGGLHYTTNTISPAERSFWG
jgi:L-alanine-DL-glutamate epimerase-like enolase superfamily enzyme